MSGYALNEAPVKTALAAGQGQRGTLGMSLPAHLRPLLVMIDGKRTVAQLLALGLRGIDLNAFDALHALDLIEAGTHSSAQTERAGAPSPAAPAAKPRLGLAEARFAAIDLLLDLSTRDFAARPWIERMEQARSLEALFEEIDRLSQSPLSAQHPGLREKLEKALRG